MPTTFRLESLPAELQSQVFDQVALTHRPTLRSLALASKGCYSNARRLLFHTINFRLTGRARLAQDVDECIAILQRRSAFALVRILVVNDARPDEPHRTWRYGLSPSVSQLINGDGGLEHGFRFVHTGCNNLVGPVISADRVAWEPLACLVRRFRALADVLYGSCAWMPSCVVQALLQHHPRCRVHLSTLRFDLQLSPARNPPALTLLTAPCLHSIWFRYFVDTGYTESGRPSYLVDAVIGMVRGLAPNLKEVHMLSNLDAAPYHPNLLPYRPPWKGFRNVKSIRDKSYGRGRLDSLELGLDLVWEGWPSKCKQLVLDKVVVESWVASTDFSLLRALSISRPVGYGALGALMLAGILWNLTTLLFACAEDESEEPEDYHEVVKQFLRRLPQLTSLEIISWPPRKDLAAALHPGLRELRLRAGVRGRALDEQFVVRVAERCPSIQTLGLTIRRSRGDATEVSLYEAIGSFASLRCLDLYLDTSPPLAETSNNIAPTDPSFNAFDNMSFSPPLFTSGYLNGHVRDTFINTAIDEALARAIFQTICTAKAHKHGPDAARLLDRVRIEVESTRGFSPGNIWGRASHDVRNFLAVLDRRWLVERDVRGGGGDDDDARGHGIRARARTLAHAPRSLKWRRPFSWRDAEHAETDVDHALCARIFRRIWPAPRRQGKEKELPDWREDWRSWPLAGTAWVMSEQEALGVYGRLWGRSRSAGAARLGAGASSEGGG